MILKVRPTQCPNRVWISCAGFTEHGTSGAAYFLASKWNQIWSEAGGDPFIIVVKVRTGQDQSAEVLYPAMRRFSERFRSGRILPFLIALTLASALGAQYKDYWEVALLLALSGLCLVLYWKK